MPKSILQLFDTHLQAHNVNSCDFNGLKGRNSVMILRNIDKTDVKNSVSTTEGGSDCIGDF